MNCMKCDEDFEEKDLDCSHDIPKYMGGTDADGRHWLCKSCHNKYDFLVLKKCLNFIGEELTCDEDKDEVIFWQIELKKQSYALKQKFQEIAKEMREIYFHG